MSQFKFYFTSSMLNMFRILIYPSSGARDFFVASPYWLCVLVSMCVGVSKQEHTTNMVMQQKSRGLLMMDILISETC